MQEFATVPISLTGQLRPEETPNGENRDEDEKVKITGILEIKDAEVESQSGTNRNGKSFQTFAQYGIAKIGDEIRRVRIRLNAPTDAHPVGRYQVDAELRVSNYGDLQTPYVLNLVPVK